MIEKEKQYCFYFTGTEKYTILPESHARELKKQLDRAGVEYQLKCIQSALCKLFAPKPYSPEKFQADNILEELYDMEKRVKALEKRE